MIEEFGNYLLKEKRYSLHTVKAYLFDLNSFQTFATDAENSTIDWGEVNYQLIRSWMVQLLDEGLETRSVNRKLSTLRSFFKWMQSNGCIESNPMARIKGPKSTKRLPEFVQESELSIHKLDHLFSNDFEGVRDRLLFEVFYQTGIRLAECIALKDTDVSNGRIKVVGKRNKERIIAISSELELNIRDYIDMKQSLNNSVSNLFVTDKGLRLYPKFVYRKINHYLSNLTSMKKQSPHVLRHTFATHLLNGGVDIEVLKEILGHGSLAATQVYTHNSFAKINEIYRSAHPRSRDNEK
jgi:integrase/recombinase XerC